MMSFSQHSHSLSQRATKTCSQFHRAFSSTGKMKIPRWVRDESHSFLCPVFADVCRSGTDMKGLHRYYMKTAWSKTKKKSFWVLTAGILLCLAAEWFLRAGCIFIIGMSTSKGKPKSWWSLPGRPWKAWLAGGLTHIVKVNSRNPWPSHWDEKPGSCGAGQVWSPRIVNKLCFPHKLCFSLHLPSLCSDKWAML